MTATVTLTRRAGRLAQVSVPWNAVEAGVAISAGLAAGSDALTGFGLDSIVEVSAAVVVLWQLKGIAEEREQLALRLIGASFFALAAYVTARSGTRRRYCRSDSVHAAAHRPARRRRDDVVATSLVCVSGRRVCRRCCLSLSL